MTMPESPMIYHVNGKQHVPAVPEEDVFDLKGVLYEKGDRRLFLGIAMFIWILMIAYSVTLYKPKYAAESLVLIKDSAINSRYVVPDQNFATQTTSSSASNPVLNTMGLLKSKSISEGLWDYMQTKHPEELTKLKIKTKSQWERFYGDGKGFIVAKNEPGTDLINIKFMWKNPVIAKEALEVILNQFGDASLRMNQNEQRNRSKYLNNQVALINSQLEKVRRNKRIYKDKVGAYNYTPNGTDMTKAQIEMANQLNQLQAKANGKESEFKRFQKMLGMTPENALTATALGLNGTLAKLQDDYYKQSQTYAQLKSTLTDKNPKVKESLAQLQQTESNIRVEMTRTLGKSSTYLPDSTVSDKTRADLVGQMVSAQAESMRLNTEADMVSKRLSSIESQISVMPSVEEDINNIEEEEKSLSAALFTLRQKQIEAELKVAESLSNVFVIDAPRMPANAMFPNQKQIWVLSFVLGLIAGLTAVVGKRTLKFTGIDTGRLSSSSSDLGIDNSPQVTRKQQQRVIPISINPKQFPDVDTGARSDNGMNLNDRLKQGILQADTLQKEVSRVRYDYITGGPPAQN